MRSTVLFFLSALITSTSQGWHVGYFQTLIQNLSSLGGAIAGIACGGIALTVVAGWVFYAVKFKKSLVFLQR